MIVAAACASGPSAGTGPRPVGLSPCSRSFVFVDHGRAAARIEIPESAGEVERRAADILRTSVFKMTGVDLPVLEVETPDWPGVAAVGFPPSEWPPVLKASLASLRPDGFAVGTSTGNLYIAGGAGRGVISGVVHLLEKYFGCRMSGPAGELFPRRDDLALGCLFETENPANDETGVRQIRFPVGTGKGV